MKYYSIHGLLKIATNVDIPVPDYFKTKTPMRNPDLEIMVKSVPVKKPKENRLVRASYYYWRDNDRLFIDYDMANAKLFFENLFGRNRKTRVQCTKTFRRFCTGESWKSFIHAIIWFKLVERGYTFIHAGALSYRRKDGIVIVAPADTGKTSTILSLLSTGDFGFLTDDAVLLGDGFIHAYPEKVKVSPYTLTGTMSFKRSLKQKFLKSRLMGLMSERLLNMKIGKLHKIPDKFLVDRSPVKKVFLLSGYGEKPTARKIDAKSAARLLILPSAEMTTLMHQYIELYYYLFNVDTHAILKKMNEIVEDSFRDAECYELKTPYLGGYAETIAKMMEKRT